MAISVSALALLISLSALWLVSAAMRKFSTEAHTLLQQSRIDRSTVMKEINDKIAALEAKVDKAAKGADSFASERQELVSKMETLYHDINELHDLVTQHVDTRTRVH